MRNLEEKLKRATEILRSMGATRVLLFGSAVEHPDTARDVDLAVEGIPPEKILAADVAVYRELEAPLDLVSREDNPAFFEVIRDYSRTLYEQSQAGA
ncbi:MAG: hypothetical protein V2A34_11325 [Lentisphaerota bacterium]